MRFSDIKEKHIYNIDFNPVRDSEFNGKHLALVIKKNNDKRTAIVVPLTRSPNGDEINKINIGKIESLPKSLKGEDSYAVFNQVRTVNSNRFIALKEGSNCINAGISKELYDKILFYCLEELCKSLTKEDKINCYYNCYASSIMDKVVNMSYDIKKLISSNLKDKDQQLDILQSKIVSLLSFEIVYNKYMKEKDINNGIVDIIQKCLKGSIKGYLDEKEAAISSDEN